MVRFFRNKSKQITPCPDVKKLLQLRMHYQSLRTMHSATRVEPWHSI